MEILAIGASLIAVGALVFIGKLAKELRNAHVELQKCYMKSITNTDRYIEKLDKFTGVLRRTQTVLDDLEGSIDDQEGTIDELSQ